MAKSSFCEVYSPKSGVILEALSKLVSIAYIEVAELALQIQLNCEFDLTPLTP